jgi:archaellum component FlaF (FlaF/FlaG flagellin family)
MQVSYQLDTTQLNINFINSIKTLFGDSKIDIIIKSEEESSRNDTEYLLSNKKNAKRLLNSIKDIEKNRDKLIYKSLEDLGIN